MNPREAAALAALDARAAHVAELHAAAARGEPVVVCGGCGGDGCERCCGVGEVVGQRPETAESEAA